MVALNPFSDAQCIVVKIGSALLIDSETGRLRDEWLGALCEDIQKIKADGAQVAIVSSGAIALGRTRLGLWNRDLSLVEKQACAAAGQSILTQAYENHLGRWDIHAGQVLFTLNDTEDRRRWLNARSTLKTLLEFGVVPVINENDTVATDEIRYGDNDRLAARTAQMIGADTLILLSDINGLYTADPRKDEKARHLAVVETLSPQIMRMGGSPNADAGVGSGGMATKLAAAQIATQAGCAMCIMDGRSPAPLSRLMSGETCSWFKATDNPRDSRSQWISGSLNPKGILYVDQGAVDALNNGKSLLAAGVTQTAGDFKKGDTVEVVDRLGKSLAHGLVSYDSDEVRKILGRQSTDIREILSYDKGGALIHRDNLVMNQT